MIIQYASCHSETAAEESGPAVQLLYSNDQILRSAQCYIIKFVRPIK